MRNPQEKQLVQRVALFKDQDAFRDLYRYYDRQIYAFILRRLNAHDDAEDLTAQVFLKVWEYITGEAGQKVWHFRGLLYRIARNELINFYRLQGRAPSPISIDNQEDPIEIADSRQDPLLKQLYASDETMLIECVQKLKEGYREAVALRFFEQLSIDEIAEIMKKSPGNIRVLLHRGLKALRTIVENSKQYDTPRI